MLKFKKYFILTGILILFSLLINLLYLLTNIPYSVISSITLIFYLIFFIILGFIIAKNKKSKGIITGLKTSSIIIIILFILTLLFKYNFSVKNIIYYLLVMLSTIFGSIISKNIKNKL